MSEGCGVLTVVHLTTQQFYLIGEKIQPIISEFPSSLIVTGHLMFD